jgi:arylsulfatase A-like enzyme
VPDARPNVLLIMTDEERYPPPYEQEALARFRQEQLPARARLRERSRELHRHHAGATACTPSRATLFTGQYPSLHGVTQTDGLAKPADDPAMRWLAPATVPTLGDWFRAGGYDAHYRGKWHVSHADLVDPATGASLAANDDTGVVDPVAVARYRAADPLEPFGFSGWIGPEPHGAAKSNCGVVRDGPYADQVAELFGQLATSARERPWLAVASFVNPHDIAFSGFGWDQILGFEPPPGTVPSIAPPPSQSDDFTGRPSAQRQFFETWPKILYEQATDEAYRRLYHHLHVLVDAAILRILDALDASGMADDTVVVFTSDHGDLLGAHGGMVQKWHNAYDEAIRVPMLVSGPGIDASAGDLTLPTSHVDVVPTLLGLAGIDVAAAAAQLAATHAQARPLPGRDLSAVLGGRAHEAEVEEPVYFMAEDQITRGPRAVNPFSGERYQPVAEPDKIESVITRLPTGEGGAPELWKLNHSYADLGAWDGEHGVAPPTGGRGAEPVEDQWEAHNLTRDPEERDNLAGAPAAAGAVAQLRDVLATQREAKRLVPTRR